MWRKRRQSYVQSSGAPLQWAVSTASWMLLASWFTGSVLDVGVADWQLVLGVNLTGTYIVVRCCLPWLVKAPFATIVNIASGQGLLPNTPNMTAYAASKGGVVNLTRALAAEFAPSIRVNSVCPGLVDTPMTAGLQREIDRYALKRIAEPLEIAQAILFLTGTESSFVTGAALAIDGGRTFHWSGRCSRGVWV
jgi:NAD(P)-dependent dehydrogenase (short-subunit alcohol dehydrogenase family)